MSEEETHMRTHASAWRGDLSAQSTRTTTNLSHPSPPPQSKQQKSVAIDAVTRAIRRVFVKGTPHVQLLALGVRELCFFVCLYGVQVGGGLGGGDRRDRTEGATAADASI